MNNHRPQLKLRRPVRWMMNVSTFLSKHTRGIVRVPHKVVLALYLRGWLLSEDGGNRWRSVRLAPDGRVLA